MEKYIYDENNGLWYELQGDYYIPCLKLPDEEQVEIGIWGQRHLEYIKHHRKGFYTSLVLDCKLNRYLSEINKQAEEMFDTLIRQFKLAEGITEQLKTDNQMLWVSKMNYIRDKASLIRNAGLTEQVNLNINSEMRIALWNKLGEDLILSQKYLCVDKEDAKNIWQKLQPQLPKYYVFRADRPSTDEDALAQDPMQIAMKAAIQEKQTELNRIAEEIKQRVSVVADQTIPSLLRKRNAYQSPKRNGWCSRMYTNQS